MTTYLGDKAVGIGTIKATKAVAGDVLHDETLVGNGNTEPLGVDKQVIATTNQVGNLATTLNAAIDAQADAIAKTRNDYEVADQKIRADMNEKDSELESMITEHAEELTTLRGNQASLGDQVAGIEEKIPESASGTNHLITKQQLLDEEMDIRDDLNEGLSELQTQITAQAAEIATKQDKLIAGDNIIISGNVITATGAGGGAGFDTIIVQELPAEGQKGIIYLLAKDSEAPDIYDEYIWVTATQTFEFIGTTQVDLSDYATKEDLDKVLPDQTDNAGKFLTTDGTTASWSDKPLVNTSGAQKGLTILGTPDTTENTVNIGIGSSGKYGAVAVGTDANGGTNEGVSIGRSTYSGSQSIAIGHNAYASGNWAIAIGGNGITSTRTKATGLYSIQLGQGANSDNDTFKVGNRYGNFEIMDANGNVPLDRLTYVTDQIGDISTALTAILGE